MPVTQSDIGEIQERLSVLVGKRVWEAYRGDESEFNDKAINIILIEADLYGQEVSPEVDWYLWGRRCEWRIETNHEVLVASQDKQDKVELVCNRLEGKMLIAIDVIPPAFEAILSFEDELILRLFPVTSKETYWVLFTADKHILDVGPGTEWSYRKDTTED